MASRWCSSTAIPSTARCGRRKSAISPDRVGDCAGLRGYGESSVVPGTVAWEAFARDIAALLDHLRVDGVVLGGLSVCGQIVMEFS